MANYMAWSRSNYFRVKSADDFQRFCERWGLTLIKKQAAPEYVGFLCDEVDSGGIPSMVADPGGCEFVQVNPHERRCTKHDITLVGSQKEPVLCEKGFEEEEGLSGFDTELMDQLAEGEVAVVLEVGAEKLRYVIGAGRVIAADGRMQYFDLEDSVMTLAKQWNPDVTLAQY